MGQPITEITIVGGGTAGWLTATLLQGIKTRTEDSEEGVRVTLIESPNVPTVGVGEATVPGMPRTLRWADISEREFVKECNASFKLGVMFRNWNVDNSGNPIDFVNPFARVPAIQSVDAGYYQLRHGAGELDFVQTYSPAVDLARAFKGPRPLGAAEYAGPVGFAYHLDAGAFARMLKSKGIANGVNHILDDVVDVEQDERGYISSLTLKENGQHPIQLVIDCTGFRGVIINQILKEPFISYSNHLANDRALAVQIPHKDPSNIPSVTQSTALGAGWVWRVPLYHRIGTGYVFSSAHRTDEQAMDEFLAHLGDEAEGAEPRVIPMRVGRTRNAWVKNCVAVGLSGGFIEPLESTAIHMIDTAVRWLALYFPDRDFPEPLRERYNKLSSALYDEVRDFICLHYALGNRTDDPYWEDARNLEMPDSLAQNLELWKYALPGPYDLGFASFFSYGVYQTVLLGKRVYETGYGSPTVSNSLPLRQDVWSDHLNRARSATQKMMADMADHRTLLTELRGELPEVENLQFASMTMPGVSMPTVSMPGAQNFKAPSLNIPTKDEPSLL
ncbi:MAG: tryptophan halogenase family protein [Boseongicola sp.]